MKNPKSKTNPIHLIKSVLCLAALLGASLTVAVAQTNGTVVGWGYNQYGQTDAPAGLGGVTAIAAGLTHSLALNSDGTVVGWGGNDDGQTNVPAGLGGVTAIAAGAFHSLALKSNGLVVAWGSNSVGQTNVPPGLSNVLAVAGGYDHSLALKSHGAVVAWGANHYGQTNVPTGLSNVVAIAAGSGHSLALKSNGTVVAWGFNSAGQTNVPAGLSGVIAVAAGGGHSLALKSDGAVAAWGYNEYGRTNVPAGLSGVIAIVAGSGHSLALKSNGTVVAWGDNSWQQTNVPTGLSNVVAIAAGSLHSLALVAEAPRVETPPANQTVPPGTTVDFSVVAAGAPPLRYQWLFNSTNNIPDATNAALRLTNVQPSQSGAYNVRVTNLFGSVTSAPAILRLVTAPVILTSSTNQTVPTGSSVDFSVVAAGTWPLFYQWFLNGTGVIPGATNSLLQLTNVQLSQSGDYTVVVTNAFGAVTSSPAWLNVFPRGGVVTTCTEAALRIAMTYGGTVTFACDGTITLSNMITVAADTVLDGTGHQVTISGGNATRVFYNNSNVTFTVIKLTIAEGGARAGGGIFNDGGTLNLTEAVLEGNTGNNIKEFNVPYLPYPNGEGGGVFNRAGVVNAVSCTFSNNSAFKWGGVAALGGAIRNESGVVRLHDCRFTHNSAQAVHMGGLGVDDHGDALGGAIHNSATLIVEACVFDENSATGGNGDRYSGYVDAGTGGGGALCNASTATVNNSDFRGNSAQGGQGDEGHYGNLDNGGPGGMGGGALGGAICNSSNLTLHATRLEANRAFGGAGGKGGDGGIGGNQAGPGGRGGAGHGGALYNSGSASVINCTLGWNTGQGGAGNDAGSSGQSGSSGGGGGDGSGGLYSSSGSLALLNCTIAFNAGYGGGSASGGSGFRYGQPGGEGGWGGTGQGGVRCDSGSGSVNNCTIAWNTGQGSAGGPGGTGGSIGPVGGNGGPGGRGGSGRGGLYGFNTALNVTNSTIAFNAGYSGAGGAGGAAGRGTLQNGQPGTNGLSGETVGGLQGSTVKLVNTLLAANTPGGNGAGSLADFGHNLSSDGSCAFTNIGSLNNTDPKLGPLANNGGLTLTMALLPGSPAIDAGDNASAPPTDQRGFPRPLGAGADIGAYEYCYPAALRIRPAQGGGVGITVYGSSGQTCRLLTSTNLSDWQSIATNQIGADGTVLFKENCAVGETQRFYRVALP